MRRLLAGLALATLASLGCARNGVEVIAQRDLPPDIYGAAGGSRSTNMIIYMVEGNRLVRVARSGRAQGSEPEVAVRRLLAGPTQQELGKGFETRIPEPVDLLGITVRDGVAEVNLDRDFQVVQDPNEPQEYILRMAQLVWTLDEIPDINAVQLLIDGEPWTVFDQFKREVTTPVARGRYSRFEPRSDKPVSEATIDI